MRYSQARKNWTIGSEARRRNPAVDLLRDVEDKNKPNKTSEETPEVTPENMTVIPPEATMEATMEVTPKSTTDATMEFTTTVAQNATAPYTLGELPVSGLAFDLIFGTETTLNLASDVWMQVTLMSWVRRDMYYVFRTETSSTGIYE
ncbi:hypothetical protein HPB48_021960 [Haemaphysalis longicornis]|uniref:Uncharacterized protein n=1 Tax=Haemaphysalis longicornis TaxID=44386 RepID=A0A9J6GAI8_HAELO|nr:hypothetical protein HPB48_021960 [Haemaphysalis longicornis]